jgi:hypothetical protein
VTELDLVQRLRMRMRRGLFATMHTMQEAAREIESLRQQTLDLEAENEKFRSRYQFVLQQWMAERLISDNLYADTVALMPINKTPYMLTYEESRRNGTISL